MLKDLHREVPTRSVAPKTPLMPTTFERCALYEEAWSEPIVVLAKRYSLSDNGLRKICKALNVPVPPVGYWVSIQRIGSFNGSVHSWW